MADDQKTADMEREVAKLRAAFAECLTARDQLAMHASEEDVRAQGEMIREQLMAAARVPVLPDGWRIKARYMHADAMLKERAADGVREVPK